jgi:hypothetical protein
MEESVVLGRHVVVRIIEAHKVGHREATRRIGWCRIERLNCCGGEGSQFLLAWQRLSNSR